MKLLVASQRHFCSNSCRTILAQFLLWQVSVKRQTFARFLQNLTAGVYESDQTWIFQVTLVEPTDAAELFVEQPSINSSGTLELLTNRTIAKMINVNITMRDSGGVERNGVDEYTASYRWQIMQQVGGRFVSVDPSNGATSGGYTVTITGQNFVPIEGSPPSLYELAGKIGDSVCTASVIFEAQTKLECTVPAGVGINHLVFIGNDTIASPSAWVGIESGAWESNPGVIFSYDPPEIYNVMPISVPSTGESVVTINGKNFGEIPAAVTITLQPQGSSTNFTLEAISTDHGELVVKVCRPCLCLILDIPKQRWPHLFQCCSELALSLPTPLSSLSGLKNSTRLQF